MTNALEQIIKPNDGIIITKIGAEIADIKVKSIPVCKAYYLELR